MKTISIKGVPVRWISWDHPAIGDPHIPSETEIDRFSSIISNGDTVIDIGAWTGDTSVVFGFLAGSSGNVIAFEPNPMAFRLLQCNAILNQDAMTIEAHNCAIMPEDKEYTFHYSDPDFCNGGFSQGLDVGIGDGICKHTVPLTVKGKRLEGFVSERKVSFIKIDAEGFDCPILESIRWLIERDRPTIMAEIFTDLSDRERLNFVSLVESMGYHLRDSDRENDVFMKQHGKSVDVILYP